MTALKRAIVYTRFSPRPDAKTSESCEIQRAICEQFAFKKGYAIVGVFDDPDRSGADGAREQLLAAIKTLRKGDTLIVWKWDRIARDLMLGLKYEQLIKEHGASVVAVEGDCPGDDPYNNAMRHIMMVISELERHMIAERTRAALRQRQRDGQRVSARVPYGWKKDPADPKRIIPDPAELELVRQMVEMHDLGASYHEIARKMPPEMARNGKWHPQKIKNIVLRTEYLPLPE